MAEKLILPQQLRGILSFCLNPSLDIGIHIADFQYGKTNLYESFRTDAGGKGLNVARMLCGIGFNCAVFMPVPAHCHDLYSYLEREQCSAITFEVPGELRMNFKINEMQPDGSLVLTEVNGTGEGINERVAQDLYLMSLTATVGNGVFVQSGSILPGISKDIFYNITTEVAKSGGISILDTTGIPMDKGVEAPVDILRTNVLEFRRLTGLPCNNSEEASSSVAAYARQKNIPLVVLAMGAAGVILSNGQRIFTAEAQLTDLKPGKATDHIQSLTGVGAAMTAGLAAVASGAKNEQSFAAYLKTVDPLWLTKLVMSVGQAAIRTPGTLMPKADEIEKWFESTRAYEQKPANY